MGCGANLIYPLLGAALRGWRFVGSDVTDAALEAAARNATANPHLAPLIELRRVEAGSPDGACAQAWPSCWDDGEHSQRAMSRAGEWRPRKYNVHPLKH